MLLPKPVLLPAEYCRFTQKTAKLRVSRHGVQHGWLTSGDVYLATNTPTHRICEETFHLSCTFSTGA
jgi:hypothetical protein